MLSARRRRRLAGHGSGSARSGRWAGRRHSRGRRPAVAWRSRKGWPTPREPSDRRSVDWTADWVAWKPWLRPSHCLPGEPDLMTPWHSRREPKAEALEPIFAWSPPGLEGVDHEIVIGL